MASYRTVAFDGVIRLAVSGTLDLAASRTILLDIARDAELCCDGLLIDLRATQGEVSYLDIHKMMTVLTDHPDEFNQRLALLDRYSDRFVKAQFFEAYATERGFQVRAFVDEAEAIAWLEEAAEEPSSPAAS